MNSPYEERRREATFDQLRQALQLSFRADRGGERRIVRLDRTASPYRSSFPLDHLTVHFDDGRHLDLMASNAGTTLTRPQGLYQDELSNAIEAAAWE